MDDIVIRPERRQDHAAIRSVVVAAFGSEAEANLVDNIRASAHYLPELALVAERGGEVVGHVMVSEVQLVADGVARKAHSLAPVGVAPHAQGRGIGTTLVRAVLERADEMGIPLLLLEGSPRYYGRLGFEHSVPLGITFDLPDWAPPEAAQVYRLRAYDPSIVGHVVYPPAFDVV